MSRRLDNPHMSALACPPTFIQTAESHRLGFGSRLPWKGSSDGGERSHEPWRVRERRIGHALRRQRLVSARERLWLSRSLSLRGRQAHLSAARALPRPTPHPPLSTPCVRRSRFSAWQRAREYPHAASPTRDRRTPSKAVPASGSPVPKPRGLRGENNQ